MTNQELKSFERDLIASYQEYLDTWLYYLVPADVQTFGRGGGGPYVSHTFSSYVYYLRLKNDGKKRQNISAFELEHYGCKQINDELQLKKKES